MQEAVLFPFLFRLIRLRGGSFLQELYDFEKILAVKKVNADALPKNLDNLSYKYYDPYCQGVSNQPDFEGSRILYYAEAFNGQK
jgi:hypothetical protein